MASTGSTRLRAFAGRVRALVVTLHQEPLFGVPVALVLVTCAALALVVGIDSVARHGLVGSRGANVYYDAVHGARHLWDRDNRRLRYGYHTVSGFNRFYKSLLEQGYDVHVETSRGFSRARLARYDVFFVGEQTYHGRFMSDDERDALIDWVEDGGGLFAVVEHTNAHYMGDVFNRLFEGLPIQARFDSIIDPGRVSRSWTELPTAVDHPVTRGVDEYRIYNGGSLDTEHGVLFSSPTSFSDRFDPENRPVNNGNQVRDEGEESGPLAGVAAFEHGKGRVVVIADHNALSNPTLYWGDHHRFATNAMRWLAGPHLNLDVLWAVLGLGALVAAGRLLRVHGRWSRRHWKGPAGAVVAAGLVLGGWHLARPPSYDLFLHTGNGSTMVINTKSITGYFSLYAQLSKEPQLRPWASRDMERGHDALLLAAPTVPYTEDQLSAIRGYLWRGRKVVYLASIGSLRSPAGAQLMDEFGFQAIYDDDPPIKGKRPWKFHGKGIFGDDIFRAYVYKGLVGLTFEGLTPIAWITKGGYHVEEEQWKNTKHRFHVVSRKRSRLGEFVVFAPVELFQDRTLHNLYEPSDVVREQMREVVIRMGKYAVGDRSEMPPD